MRSASGVAKKASLSFSAALVHFFVFSPSPPLPVSATAVAVASAMEIGEPQDLAEEAEKAAYITAGIPGCKAHGKAVGLLARHIVKAL